MYVCMYVCMHACMYECMCMYEYIHVCVRVHIYICVRIHMTADRHALAASPTGHGLGATPATARRREGGIGAHPPCLHSSRSSSSSSSLNARLALFEFSTHTSPILQPPTPLSPQSRCRCGQGRAHSPGADVEGASPVPVPMRQGHGEQLCSPCDAAGPGHSTDNGRYGRWRRVPHRLLAVTRPYR